MELKERLMNVSILISSRNREGLMQERALRSIHELDHVPEVNLFIIDDASEPKYERWPCAGFYQNKKRRGLAYNRNFLAGNSDGKYIVHLDDDNEFLPGFLEQTVAYLDAHPEDAAVSVGKLIQYPEGLAYQPPVVDGSMCDGFLMRRKAFLDIKCDPELTAQEDADFGIRFHKKYKVGAIHKPLMRVWASPIFNTTSYSDYSDYHLDGLAKFWLKHHAHDYRKYIGRMFLLAAGSPKWFKWGYWLETKLKRYYQILFSRP